MKRTQWLEALREAVAGLEAWEERWPGDAAPEVDDEARRALEALVTRLGGNYPFFHPRYAGQMLKPPHPVAWAAYSVTALINPNNHALDGGPPTAELEREVVAKLAALLGYDPGLEGHLGHLTSGGTVANLEALWVAREQHPGRAIAFSAQAHYTHGRMCGVLGVEGVPVAADDRGRMDLDALEDALRSGRIGTVVATPGTTALGALDPVQAILPLARRYGARVHVDAAYGGFFALLARRDPPLVDPAVFGAIGEADSAVIDPHKHGLQPYGCGCVLFRDPSMAAHYVHDSPYTYYSSAERHLGEISLECSRAGAAAAALWVTLEAIPLIPHGGLGERLAAGRRAALGWAECIGESARFRLVMPPETDILAFAPVPAGRRVRASQISAWSQRLFERAMSEEVYLAVAGLDRALLQARWPDAEIVWDVERVSVLRSVVMKPEHEGWWPRLHAALERLSEELIARG